VPYRPHHVQIAALTVAEASTTSFFVVDPFGHRLEVRAAEGP